MHDMDEVAGGDINRPFKYHTKEFAKLINSTQHEICSTYWNKSICDDIDHSKDTSCNGRIVAFVDVLSAFYKMIDEILLGNYYMKSQLDNISITMRNFNYGNLIDEYPNTYNILKECSNQIIEVCNNYSV